MSTHDSDSDGSSVLSDGTADDGRSTTTSITVPSLADHPAPPPPPPQPEPQPDPVTLQIDQSWPAAPLCAGNLLSDIPVPRPLRALLGPSRAVAPPERNEFSHVRYAAVTVPPADFVRAHYVLRPAIFARPRRTYVLASIHVPRDDETGAAAAGPLARTLAALAVAVEHACAQPAAVKGAFGGDKAWQQVVVAVIGDGLAITCGARTLLTALGVHPGEFRAQRVNSIPVVAGISEYTTPLRPSVSSRHIRLKRARAPVQLVFVDKAVSRGAFDSQQWAASALGGALAPIVWMPLVAGDAPSKDALIELYREEMARPLPETRPAAASANILETSTTSGLAEGSLIPNPQLVDQFYERQVQSVKSEPSPESASSGAARLFRRFV